MRLLQISSTLEEAQISVLDRSFAIVSTAKIATPAKKSGLFCKIRNSFYLRKLVRQNAIDIVQIHCQEKPAVSRCALMGSPTAWVEGAGSAEIYFRALLKRRVPKRIPTLMYHKVVQADYVSAHKTYVSENTFARHLGTLRSLGYDSVTFKDIFDTVITNKSLPRKPIMITFDDGYRGTFTRALPLLRRFGFRAVFYVLGNSEIKKNTWDPEDSESELISVEEWRALKQAGMEIGAHSVTHRKLSDLSDADLRWEIVESKKFLEKILGDELLSFAYPYGNLCERSKVAVRETGFPFAVATDSGGLTWSSDPWQIFRASMFPQDGPFQLWKKASSWYRGYYFWKRGK